MQKTQRRRRALLFGDDSRRLCEQAARLVRQDYEVTTVTSSMAASRLLAGEDYEVVLLLAPGLERNGSAADMRLH